MKQHRQDEATWHKPLAATPASTESSGASHPLMDPGGAQMDRRGAHRVHAVSTFLLSHPTLLLPLAAHFRERQPVFESTIRGPSMHPAIPRRARLRVQLLRQRPCRPSDVVFYLAENGYMVHRVVYAGRRGAARDYLLTCGDNRLAPDPPIQSRQILGIVIAVQTASGWRHPGPLTPGPFYKRMIRVLTLALMCMTLWCSVAAARRLATILLTVELAGRLSIQRLRRCLPRQKKAIACRN